MCVLKRQNDQRNTRTRHQVTSLLVTKGCATITSLSVLIASSCLYIITLVFFTFPTTSFAPWCREHTSQKDLLCFLTLLPAVAEHTSQKDLLCFLTLLPGVPSTPAGRVSHYSMETLSCNFSVLNHPVRLIHTLLNMLRFFSFNPLPTNNAPMRHDLCELLLL